MQENNRHSGVVPHSRPQVGELEAEAAAAAIFSGWIKGGARVEELENKIASDLGYTGAVCVSHGSIAISIALAASGIGKGDGVAIPSYVCRDVIDAVYAIGADPIVGDSSIDHFSINQSCLDRQRFPNLKAVLLTSLFGIRAPGREDFDSDLLLIEDACQRLPHPSNFKEDRHSNIIISFEATKLITSGEGGCFLSKDLDLLNRARTLRNAPYSLKERGYAFPLTDIQAAVAGIQWSRYSELLNERRTLAKRYAEHLPPGITTGPYGFTSHTRMLKEDTIPYRWIGWCEKADALIASAQSKGILFKRPVAPQALHQWLGLSSDAYPNTEKMMKQLISLPMFPGLAERDQTRILKVVLNG